MNPFRVGISISLETGEAKVGVSVANLSVELAPLEARQLGVRLLGAAADAESDGFLLRFLATETGQMTPEARRSIMESLSRFRHANRQGP